MYLIHFLKFEVLLIPRNVEESGRECLVTLSVGASILVAAIYKTGKVRLGLGISDLPVIFQR